MQAMQGSTWRGVVLGALALCGAAAPLAVFAGPAMGQCEVQKRIASDGAAGDWFGSSPCISGDTAVVSASTDDDNGENSGSVYVFRWNGSTWVEEQKLLASDGYASHRFGWGVAVSGDVVVVSTRYDDDLGTNSGAAYIFRWNGSTWVEEQKLHASDGREWHWFGDSISISGDVVVAGAYGDDDNGIRAGAAYVFRWNGSTWAEEQKLLASDGEAEDNFSLVGLSVSGDTVMIGAANDDDNGESSGSAYFFSWNGSAWIEEQKLHASDGEAGDLFGWAKVSGDLAVIGARGDDDNGDRSGSAYVFRWDGSTWVEEQKLLASDGGPGHIFGWKIALSGDVIVVGVPADDGIAEDAGAAYVFRWNGSTWVEERKLYASDGEAEDWFGRVAISGDVLFVGAIGDDDNGTDSGGVYVFDLSACLCPADIDGNGAVDFDDLLRVLDAWGNEGGPEDLDGSGLVDFGDLLIVLDAWGPCE